jgi:hypothetical protein
MIRWLPRLACLLALIHTLPALGEPVAEDEKGTYLGALFAPVPDALYEHLPQLPRQQGVLITHVLPGSPAASADLRRHDILLQYDHTAIRNCEHFVRLIREDRPGRTVQLRLLRSGKPLTTAVVLVEGPALKIARPGRPADPAVSVSATPLTDGKMRVTIAYPRGPAGQVNQLTCEGGSADIDRAVQQLPARERSLVQAALERIRQLSSTRRN